MPAPGNDDFANATAITNLTGTSTGTNTSATAEASEPGWPIYNPAAVYPQYNTDDGPYASVWYAWTCPAFPAFPNSPCPSVYQVPVSGEIKMTVEADFASTIQIWGTSGAVPPFSNLVRYPLVLDEHAGVNNGLGNNSTVSFVAYTGDTYYIQVSGRNNAQGNFTLAWSPFDRPTLGGCAHCQPTSAGAQVLSWQYTNTTTPFSGTIATLTAGVYEINWCKGGMLWGTAGTPAQIWDVGQFSAGAHGPSWQFFWPESNYLVGPGVGSGMLAGFGTQAEQEQAYSCESSGPFQTCGGSLTVIYGDAIICDNVVPVTSPAPTFEVVELAGVGYYSGISVGGVPTLTGTSPTWSCTFPINWALFGPIYNLTVALANANGVSGASAPQVITLNNGLNYVTFTFTAALGASFCTADLQLSLCGTVIKTLSWALYPTVLLSNPAGIGSPGSCGTGYTHAGNVQIRLDVGSFPTLAQLGATSVTLVGTSSPWPLTDRAGNPCTTVANDTATWGGTTVAALNLFALFPNGSTTVNNTYTVVPSIGSLTYPTFTVTYPVP